MTFITLDTIRVCDAHTSTFSGIVAHIKQVFSEYLKRRKLVSEFSRMSEKAKRDIGLTSGDISTAASMPFTHCVSDELYRMKLTRSRNW